MSLQTVVKLLTSASPETLPLIGVASVWLWNAAEDGATAAHCVDECMTLHYALAEFGIASRVEAVTVEVESAKGHTRYGHEDGPRYNSDGSFNADSTLEDQHERQGNEHYPYRASHDPLGTEPPRIAPSVVLPGFPPCGDDHDLHAAPEVPPGLLSFAAHDVHRCRSQSGATRSRPQLCSRPVLARPSDFWALWWSDWGGS
jgi:hypothetical protein